MTGWKHTKNGSDGGRYNVRFWYNRRRGCRQVNGAQADKREL